jgi:hypothetical protein
MAHVGLLGLSPTETGFPLRRCPPTGPTLPISPSKAHTQARVSRYLRRRPAPPSPSLRHFGESRRPSACSVHRLGAALRRINRKYMIGADSGCLAWNSLCLAARGMFVQYSV